MAQPASPEDPPDWNKLSSARVEEVLRDCLFRDGEPAVDAVFVEGIVRKFGFHPERLDTHRDEIHEMLSELPQEFQKGSGGGWSFLNACYDKHGKQWGNHPDMEALFVLGIATKQARWLLPREMWKALPGEMPYVVVMP